MQKTSYGQARLSIIPIRAQASHNSEMVSQLLYNETYTILEEQKEWLFIECLHDGYQGWMARNQANYISQEIFDTPFKRYNSSLIEWDAQLQQHLYMGSPFYDLAPSLAPPIERICRAAQEFVNSPYLWGGRTAAGIDCSGLMQVAFRMGNILLPRDASQQVNIGKKIEWGAHKKGDLAFFSNKNQKITHVGLILDPNTVLHASAWVRIDFLEKRGIFHKNEHTHNLTTIKRIL
ncbi:C40 family peptidase [Aureispira anguillae]|uniref:C40 family peptidase n=1 Tax=Aureispira anguillae TaxID=2864201 RepID=A0A915Y9R0_9BACT|nr:C40 family peptidase [Aureispira anguillae]BDS09713.1 C40 family peptidase [Aureispira anguillae]